MNQACTLGHYVPTKDNYEGLLIRITEMDDLEANKVVDGRPELPLDEHGVRLSKEDAVRRTKLRVGVFVGAKIEVKIDDPSGLQLVPLI